jgi:hypothetical protein
MAPDPPRAPRIALIGHGVTGSRIAQRIPLMIPDARLIHVDTRDRTRAATALVGVSAAVIASAGPHAEIARELIDRQIATVSIADQLDDVSELLELDDAATLSQVPLVVGAGMSPGLSGLLARYLADQLTSCAEIHVAEHGTAGPECARQHHRALAGSALGFHDGEWIRRTAGSGRELCWFPEPVGSYDCYRAELASPLLLRGVFTDVDRLSARISANRRDRLTARLPMLRRPHSEGGIGALRIEVRGSDRTGARITLVAGIAELVGTAAAATATAFLHAAVAGSLMSGVVRAGDARLDTIGILHTIERLGVRLQEFTGVPSTEIVRAAA